MESTKLLAGARIEARCTKCRKNTQHTILTLVDIEPDKVECNSCSRQHAYRPATIPKKATVRRVVDPKVAEQKEWQTLRPSMDREGATDYSMTVAYKTNALMNHPIFGIGIVQRVVGARKVEVLFEDGKKTMRCK
jgi:hypothetical protein